MSSSAERDNFWSSAEGWRTHPRPRISVELAFLYPVDTSELFTGTVEEVNEGVSITFADVETGELRLVNFAEAEIRFASFDRLDSVRAFSIASEGPDFERCLIVELRGTM